MSNNEEIVRRIATKLNALDENGRLVELDSLTVLDFVTELEEALGKSLPATQIRRSNFESVSAIVALLDQL